MAAWMERHCAAPRALLAPPGARRVARPRRAPEGWSFRDIEEEYRVDPITGEGRWVALAPTSGRGRFGRKPAGYVAAASAGGGGGGGAAAAGKPGRRKKRRESEDDEDFDEDDVTDDD